MKYTKDLLKNASGPIAYGLTNDYMFRAVLQRSNETLKRLLSALLITPYENIASCEITNPIVLGESIDDKTCIMDVRVMLNNNRLINLEMQMGHLDNWCNRALFYLCRLFCNIRSGQDYSKILPAMHIGILSESPFNDMDEFYSEYLLTNTKHPHIFSRNFSLRMLNLNQLDHIPEKERTSELCLWARLFKARTWEDIRMLTNENKSLKEAANHLRVLSEEEKIQIQCEGRERYFMDMSCSRNEGIAEGMKKGMETAMKLSLRLVEDNRIEDFKRAACDPDFQKILMSEYGI